MVASLNQSPNILVTLGSSHHHTPTACFKTNTIKKKKKGSTQFLFLGSKIFQDLASQPSAKDLPHPALRPRTSQSSSPRARARAHPSGEKQGLPLPVAGHHPTLDQTMN